MGFGYWAKEICFILALLLCVAIALAQVGSTKPDPQYAWPGPLLLPIAGIPVSFEAVEKGLDDSTIVRKCYRDASGRLLLDPYFDASRHTVLLIDPVSNTIAILESSSMVVHTIPLPKSASGNFQFVRFSSPSVEASALATENLGKQLLDSIEYEGFRTRSSEHDEMVIEEHWFSRDLGIIGLVKSRTARGERTARVQHLVKGDPDPKLFVIPQDYTILKLDWTDR